MSNVESGSAMTTRAVFLDIDGVFHPSTAIEGKDPAIPMDVYAKNHDLLRWTPVLAEMLQGHEDVMLFVHSNWRTAVSNATLRELLGPLGKGRLFQGVTDVNVGVLSPNPRSFSPSFWRCRKTLMSTVSARKNKATMFFTQFLAPNRHQNDPKTQ